MSTVKQFKDFGLEPFVPRLIGGKIHIEEILNLDILVHSFEIVDSKYKGKCMYLQITHDGKRRVIFTTAMPLIKKIQEVPIDGFPFTVKIIKDNKYFIFV
jgi:hypothetical protein